jgi:hypothetical protein
MPVTTSSGESRIGSTLPKTYIPKATMRLLPRFRLR